MKRSTSASAIGLVWMVFGFLHVVRWGDYELGSAFIICGTLWFVISELRRQTEAMDAVRPFRGNIGTPEDLHRGD